MIEGWSSCLLNTMRGSVQNGRQIQMLLDIQPPDRGFVPSCVTEQAAIDVIRGYLRWQSLLSRPSFSVLVEGIA